MTTFYDILVLNSVYIRYDTWHLYVVSEENNDTTRTVYTLATDNTKRTTAQSQWETCVQYSLSASARGFNSSCVKRERGGEQMYMYNYVMPLYMSEADIILHVCVELMLNRCTQVITT